MTANSNGKLPRPTRERRQLEDQTQVADRRAQRRFPVADRRLDSLARRVADAKAHAARMRALYPRKRAAQAIWRGALP